MSEPSPNANALLALQRIVTEASFADGPEEALWVVTRTLPSLLGTRPPQANVGTGDDGARPRGAATAFMLTPDERFHLITAPVNFLPEQYHEKVAIELGHPAHVARTRHPLLLRNTTHHESFVKILQTFRAGSAMFAPMTWGQNYLGVLICACSVPETFTEQDLAAHQAFAAAAAALWMAHDGPAWLRSIDYSGLPERHQGT